VIRFTVNGKVREVPVEARTHLADLLREGCGLTGTHLGCEQGVCGACTVLVEGVPMRACLIYAGEAKGLAVTTIEGLDEDPVAARLRDAFNRHHALQCGYCTPGMMMTARDIVTRLGAVEEARIRVELAGNLCRCTGYLGIVRAIAEVAAERPAAEAIPPRPAAAPRSAPPAPPVVTAFEPGAPAIAVPLLSNRLEHTVPLGLGVDAAWAVLSDPARIAACLPGVRLLRHEGETVEGEIAVRLGPFAARFGGEGSLALDAARRSGVLRGRGRDGANGAEGAVSWRVEPEGAGSRLHLELAWRLSGPLAQFSRPALVRGVVAGLAADFARNLEKTARGEAARAPSAWALLLRVLRGWLRRR
jgi:carbon-monoxide dehydrogenase small subunit